MTAICEELAPDKRCAERVTSPSSEHTTIVIDSAGGHQTSKPTDHANLGLLRTWLYSGLEPYYSHDQLERRATMSAPATQNPDWGFWGTATRNGYDPQMTWDAAADALATAVDLKCEEVGTLLDPRFGRHLADDLSFIAGGPSTPEAIEHHIMARLAERGWRRWFETAVREAKAVVAENRQMAC